MADYTVIRSRRRTIALEITRQGTALVRAPLHAADADIARFVDSHRAWLDKHLAARQSYMAAHPEPSAEQPCEAVELFATKTCPNCKQAEQLLDAADIRYTVRFAEENRDTVRALGIRQAPTLVSGGQKWTGVSGVREFIAAKENANV